MYGSLANSITLQASTSYYVVTQESIGGDTWYDSGTLAATSVAAVNNSIYSYDSVTWIPLNGANTSYVPPNFQYTTSVASTIPITVQGSPAGVSFSVDGTAYTTAQSFNWTSGSQHTIATTSPQGTGTQYVFTKLERRWSDFPHRFADQRDHLHGQFHREQRRGRGSDGFHHRVRAEQSSGAEQFGGWVGMKFHGGRKRDQRHGTGTHLPGREQRDAHG